MANTAEAWEADRWLVRGREPPLEDVLSEPMFAPVMTPRTVKLIRLAAMLARLKAQRPAA
jgi:hypothetical protein